MFHLVRIPAPLPPWPLYRTTPVILTLQHSDSTHTSWQCAAGNRSPGGGGERADWTKMGQWLFETMILH